MSKNEQRLTARELELKNEVSELVKQLNEKLFELKKSGINAGISSKPINDGLPNFYVGVYAHYDIPVF